MSPLFFIFCLFVACVVGHVAGYFRGHDEGFDEGAEACDEWWRRNL